MAEKQETQAEKPPTGTGGQPRASFANPTAQQPQSFRRQVATQAATRALPGMDRSALVLGGGLLLFVVNANAEYAGWLVNVWDAITGQPPSNQSNFNPLTIYKEWGMQLAGILGLSVVAGLGNEGLANIAVLMIVAAWLLWLYVHIGNGGKRAATSTNQTNSTTGKASPTSAQPAVTT